MIITKPKRLIRRKEVERRTTLSRSKIYQLMNESLFPRAILLGSKSVAWIESEVEEWISARIANSRQLSKEAI
jgi:prophage regulatory protein